MSDAAYADLVAALLDATPHAAADRFDAAVADAVQAGTLDPEAARTLRWLQRETVRAVRDHAAATLPALVTALVASAADEAARVTQLGHGEPADPGDRDRPGAPEAPTGTVPTATVPTATVPTGTVPTGTAPTATAPPAAAPPESRRRTLVAGLTALSDRPQ